MAFLEKLKLFTEGFVEGWKEEGFSADDEVEAVDALEFDFGPEPFDMTHDLYHGHLTNK